MIISDKNKANLFLSMFFLATFCGLAAFFYGHFLVAAVLFSILAVFSEALVQYSNVEPNDSFVNTIIQKIGLK